MGKVRIAVAGAGVIGLRHIEEIVASPNCVLSAIVDPGPNAAEVARKHGVPLYQSLSECSPRTSPRVSSRHAQPDARRAGARCIDAGVPAWWKSRSGTPSKKASAWSRSPKKANHKLLTGHHRPHSPILHKAVEIVQSGVLGPLVA